MSFECSFLTILSKPSTLTKVLKDFRISGKHSKSLKICKGRSDSLLARVVEIRIDSLSPDLEKRVTRLTPYLQIWTSESSVPTPPSRVLQVWVLSFCLMLQHVFPSQFPNMVCRNLFSQTVISNLCDSSISTKPWRFSLEIYRPHKFLCSEMIVLRKKEGSKWKRRGLKRSAIRHSGAQRVKSPPVRHEAPVAMELRKISTRCNTKPYLPWTATWINSHASLFPLSYQNESKKVFEHNKLPRRKYAQNSKTSFKTSRLCSLLCNNQPAEYNSTACPQFTGKDSDLSNLGKDLNYHERFWLDDQKF